MKKMKRDITLLNKLSLTFIFFIIVVQSIAQNTYTLHCKDADTGENIQNIEIHDVDKKLGFTDSEGKVNISTRHNMIFCSHISYADTVIHLSQSQKIIINLNKEKTQLSEGIVKSKYNQCKHLERLLKENVSQTKYLDTILYYSFNCNYSIVDTDYQSELSAILRLHFTGYEDLRKAHSELSRHTREYYPRKDYKLRTVNITNYSNNIPDDYRTTHLTYTMTHSVIGYHIYMPEAYRNECKSCKLQIPYRNQDSLVFHFNKTDTYNRTAQITFVKNQLRSVITKDKSAYYSDSIEDNSIQYILEVDSSSRIITHQSGLEQFKMTLPNGDKCEVKQRFSFNILDSVPKNRNTDIVFLNFETPMRTYKWWNEMHKKYYIPEMQLPETPNIIKQLYEKDEEKY